MKTGQRNRDLKPGDTVRVGNRGNCTFIRADDVGHDRCLKYVFATNDASASIVHLYAESGAPAGTNDVPHANWASD